MRRLLTVARCELRAQLRRPMLWILLLIVGLLTVGLSTGNVTVSSGDSSVGGDKAWLNSEFAVTQVVTILCFLFFAFFSTIAAGMTVIEDEETGIGEILHATPLRAREYVWGKFLGVLGALTVILALQMLVSMLALQLMPVDDAEEVRGPFRLLAYLRPYLFFAFPTLIFFAGAAFAIGERSRRPIVIFVLPVAVVMACVFFLWSWTPSWLDPRVDRLLMVLDPAGFRWLDRTWMAVDRGVAFFNTSSVSFDLWLLLNRAWIVGLGLLGVALSVPHLRGVIAGRTRTSRRRQRKERRRQEAESAAPAEAVPAADLEQRRLGELAMTSKPPGFLGSLLPVLRAELRELRNQPGLYLFVPLILLQVIQASVFAIGAFDTPLLLTPGTIAVRTMNTLTLLVCLLLLFYTVESLDRDRASGLASILWATPARSGAMLLAKALANSVVGLVIVLAALLAAWIALAIQGEVPFRLGPFTIVWGLLLIPTFVLWTTFVAAVSSVVRERYTTYGIALGAILATGYYQFRGDMFWAFNWNLWSAITWSDMGTLELWRTQLAINRLTALGAALFFAVIAVRFFPRRELDAGRIVQRLRPPALARTGLRLLPVALPALAGALVLGWQVRHGFQGELAEKRSKDYWRQNLATWRDWEGPAIAHVDIDLELEPARRAFSVEGSYRLRNDHLKPVRELLLTIDRDWIEPAFTLDGESVEPQDRSGLQVFELEEPMQPGDELELGFAHSGRVPRGATKNGGGAPVFILDSGVVLHTFGPSFLPVLGYLESIGVDEDNRYEPREYAPGRHREVLASAFGVERPFTTRVEITLPEDFTANSVGALVSERVEDGRRTVVWESDHPVKILNVVAGRWAVRRAGGTAVFYHPEHSYNVDEISAALEAAREHYSEWFHPYPWRELKLSEFPNLATYAQGFPTNVTFSEGIGFLTRSDPRSNAAFLVTAHEAAHQWWGNLVTPAEGPGGNVLSEGMSHYSTLLLQEQVLGERYRIQFARAIESRYAENRQVDSERPLVEVDGSRAGDTTATYDKGGWVMWMLHDLMGRENALAGLQDLQRRFIPGPDHPLLEDLVETLRPYAPDPEAYDAFVEQWFFDVVVPEYRLRDAEASRSGDGWEVTVEVENVGTGRMPVEVAATRGTRFPDQDEDGAPAEPYREARATVVLDAGASETVRLRTDFEPESLLVDPDAKVLQLGREKAVARL
ncbi:MAG TPA: ABC transporter permease subunit [Thermoanaerobaculia bacterium]|nr:ABC transporter permease subunit [Thermoanaerobaculia bacterium]